LILGTNIESGSLSSRLYKKAINKTGVITPAEGFTIHEERCVQKGNVVEIHFYIDTQTAFSGEKLIAVISGVDPPPKPIRMMTGAGNAPYAITEPTALYLGNNGRMAAQPVNSVKAVLVDIVYTID
jgi:hypothetical protein